SLMGPFTTIAPAGCRGLPSQLAGPSCAAARPSLRPQRPVGARNDDEVVRPNVSADDPPRSSREREGPARPLGAAHPYAALAACGAGSTMRRACSFRSAMSVCARFEGALVERGAFAASFALSRNHSRLAGNPVVNGHANYRKFLLDR